MYDPRNGSSSISSSTSGYGLGSTEQTMSVTDIVSEGPIAGLVLGAKSIFLNDDALFDDQEVGFTSTSGMSISSNPSDSSKLVIANFFILF